jgi:hypothetical protein
VCLLQRAMFVHIHFLSLTRQRITLDVEWEEPVATLLGKLYAQVSAKSRIVALCANV